MRNLRAPLLARVTMFSNAGTTTPDLKATPLAGYAVARNFGGIRRAGSAGLGALSPQVFRHLPPRSADVHCNPGRRLLREPVQLPRRTVPPLDDVSANLPCGCSVCQVTLPSSPTAPSWRSLTPGNAKRSAVRNLRAPLLARVTSTPLTTFPRTFRAAVLCAR